MSRSEQIVDILKDPMVIGIIIIGAILGYFLETQFLNNVVLSVILTIGIIVTAILIYHDYIEKQKTQQKQEKKTEELLRKRREQENMERQEGKCISCLAELPEGAEECPECGFEVKHYHTDTVETPEIEE